MSTKSFRSKTGLSQDQLAVMLCLSREMVKMMEGHLRSLPHHVRALYSGIKECVGDFERDMPLLPVRTFPADAASSIQKIEYELVMLRRDHAALLVKLSSLQYRYEASQKHYQYRRYLAGRTDKLDEHSSGYLNVLANRLEYRLSKMGVKLMVLQQRSEEILARIEMKSALLERLKAI